MYSYTITIGRNTSTRIADGHALSDDDWADFNTVVRNYFWAMAEDWRSPENSPVVEVHTGIGFWEGTAEASTKITLLSEGTMNNRELHQTRAFLTNLANKYNQDAIAFTIGESELVTR